MKTSTAIMSYDAARHAIDQARTIDDAKGMADKAAALRVYARQARDPEMEAMVCEIRIRARRRIGELTGQMERAPNHHTRRNGATTKRDALAAAGITKDEAHRCEKLASVPAEAFERVIAEKRDAGKAVTADDVEKYVAKRQKQARPKERIDAEADRCGQVEDLHQLAETGIKFQTVYADPAWKYGNQGTRGSTDDHYPGMSVDEICALPVAQFVDKDAHLHLWTTNAFLFEAQRVMTAWGFEYKSCYVWVKPQMGMGNYWRVSHELMLFGIRGSAPFGSRSKMSWGQFKRGKHSAKPEEVRGIIEEVSPGPRRIELFARRMAPNWYAWGNEVEKSLMDMVAEAA